MPFPDLKAQDRRIKSKVDAAPNSSADRSRRLASKRAKLCDSDRITLACRRGGRRGTRSCALGLGLAGPAGGRLRARLCAASRGSLCLCRFQLHDRPAPGARRPGDRTRRRGYHGQPLVYRHGQLHPVLRRDAYLCRHRSPHLQHRSQPGGRSDHPAHPRDDCRPPDGHAVRSGGPRARWPIATARLDRRRGLRRRQPDPSERRLGAHRQAARAVSPASPSIHAR